MGGHLMDGLFKSDKYPNVPKGICPLKPSDPMAWLPLYLYAKIRYGVDSEFAADLMTALHNQGFDETTEHMDLVALAREMTMNALYQSNQSLKQLLKDEHKPHAPA